MVQTKRPLTYGEIAAIFIRTGSQSFGGWSTTALLLEKELVDKRHVLSAQQIKAATSYAQILPGATQVAIVSNLGHQLRGVTGAIIATACYLCPAIALIILFAAVYFQTADTDAFAQYLDGLQAGLAAIIIANAYRIGKKHTSHPALWLAIALSFVCLTFLHIHALIILAAFAVNGMAWYWFKVRKST